MKVTLKQIAEKLGVRKCTIIKRKNKEGWEPSGNILHRGGKIEIFELSSLPHDIQALFKGNGKEIQINLDLNRAEIKAINAPEKAKKIALARYELVRMWQKERAKKQWGDLLKTDEEFISAYNTGEIYKSIYEILGKVSLKTLYRWLNLLEGTNEWTRLIPGYWEANQRETKLLPEERKILIDFLLDPRKLKIQTAIKYAKIYLKSKGYTDKELASDMAYRRYAEWWIRKNYGVYIWIREGNKAYEDKVGYYLRRDPSQLEVGEVLVADGHRLNFQVLNPFTGKPCRAVMVAFLDWKSFDIVGYEIMLEENTQCIASALRNAIIRLGKIPKIIYVDNGKAFRAKYFTRIESFEDAHFSGLFARLGIKPIYAKPYNAKAKIIENWFKTFTDQFERLMPSYVGSGIKDKPAWLLRNEKHHKAMHKGKVPTIFEAISFIETFLKWYRTQECPYVKGKTIGEVFEEGKGEGIDINMLDDLMMEVKITKIGRHGIRLMGMEYWHDSFVYYRGTVRVRYSLFDLSYVKVYTEKGEFIGIAERVPKVHPVAKELGNVKDVETLKRELSRQQRLKRKIVAEAKELLKRKREISIDWQKIIEVEPSIVKEIEKQELVLPGIEEHIPDEAIKRDMVDQKPEELNQIERPFFGDNVIARYEWHLKNGFNSPEDWEFKQWFEASDIYRMLYQNQKINFG